MKNNAAQRVLPPSRQSRATRSCYNEFVPDPPIAVADHGIKVELDRQPAYYADGRRKPTADLFWPVIPRVGDEISFQDGDPDINGVVHAVIWFSPTSVRIVVKEHF